MKLKIFEFFGDGGKSCFKTKMSQNQLMFECFFVKKIADLVLEKMPFAFPF